jgi:RNA polymerase sigma-70 factor, ECF subfamily
VGPPRRGKMCGALSSRHTDAEIIEASWTQPRRFEAIFDRHYQPVRAYLQRRAGIQAGEDLAAETFVQAFKARTRYDTSRAEALPWLLGIGTNILRRHWRAERARLQAWTREASSRRDEEPGPEERAGELDPGLVEAVGRLRPGDRDALLLLVWAELSYQEVGEALGIPTGTVRSRIHRGRRMLRELLGGEAAIQDERAASEEGEMGDR